MTSREIEALLKCPNKREFCRFTEPHFHMEGPGGGVFLEDPIAVTLRALATELLECRRVLVEYHRANDAIWLPEGGARVGTTDAEWQRHDRAEVALDRLAARIAKEDSQGVEG